MVILSAVVIITIRNDDIVGLTATGTVDYAYEEEKEKISDAIYQALIQSFIRDDINFNYAQVPEKMKEILEATGQFECELINSDDNGYSIYHITPVEKGFYFILRMSHTNGDYTITRGE